MYNLTGILPLHETPTKNSVGSTYTNTDADYLGMSNTDGISLKT